MDHRQLDRRIDPAGYVLDVKRKQYSEEWIQLLVRQVLEDGAPLCALARQNGVHPGVLSKWVKKRRGKDVVNVVSNFSSIEDPQAVLERLMHLEDRIETLRSILEKHLRMQYKE